MILFSCYIYTFPEIVKSCFAFIDACRVGKRIDGMLFLDDLPSSSSPLNNDPIYSNAIQAAGITKPIFLRYKEGATPGAIGCRSFSGSAAILTDEKFLEDSGKTWIFLHELGHIKNNDCLTEPLVLNLSKISIALLFARALSLDPMNALFSLYLSQQVGPIGNNFMYFIQNYSTFFTKQNIPNIVFFIKQITIPLFFLMASSVIAKGLPKELRIMWCNPITAIYATACLLLADGVSRVTTALFSRYREREADRFAAELGSLNDLKEGLSHLTRCQEKNRRIREEPHSFLDKLCFSSSGEFYLDIDHPSLSSRIAYLKRMIAKKTNTSS